MLVCAGDGKLLGAGLTTGGWEGEDQAGGEDQDGEGC